MVGGYRCEGMGDIPREETWKDFMPSLAEVAGLATKMETLVIQPVGSILGLSNDPTIHSPFRDQFLEGTLTIEGIDKPEQGGGLDFKIQFSTPDADDKEEESTAVAAPASLPEADLAASSPNPIISRSRVSTASAVTKKVATSTRKRARQESAKDAAKKKKPFSISIPPALVAGFSPETLYLIFDRMGALPGEFDRE